MKTECRSLDVYWGENGLVTSHYQMSLRVKNLMIYKVDVFTLQLVAAVSCKITVLKCHYHGVRLITCPKISAWFRSLITVCMKSLPVSHFLMQKLQYLSFLTTQNCRVWWGLRIFCNLFHLVRLPGVLQLSAVYNPAWPWCLSALLYYGNYILHLMAGLMTSLVMGVLLWVSVMIWVMTCVLLSQRLLLFSKTENTEICQEARTILSQSAFDSLR